MKCYVTLTIKKVNYFLIITTVERNKVNYLAIPFEKEKQ